MKAQPGEVESQPLRAEVKWFTHLRWIAGVGVGVVTLLADRVLGVLSAPVPLYCVAGILLLYNGAFTLWFRRNRDVPTSVLRRLAYVQVILDLLALGALLHYSGGIENPFAFYSVFHVVIASILLSKRDSHIVALLGCAIYGAVTGLEYFGVLDHHPLLVKAVWLSSLWREPLVLVSGFLILASTLLITAYLAGTVMDKLRASWQRQQELQRMLAESEKLAAIGQLATNVAHEIKNPLTGIAGVIRVFETQLSSDPEAKEILGEVYEQINRLDRTLNQLVNFARPAPPKMVECSLNDLVEGTLALVSPNARKQKVLIETHLDPELPPTIVDPDQMQQIFINLMLNAIQAMPNGGRLSIQTISGQNGELVVKVSDTGCGIPHENLDKIFSPFFTTKARGTGLGLAIVKNVLSSHGGRVSVESTPGKGTTFTILLPATGSGAVELEPVKVSSGL